MADSHHFENKTSPFIPFKILCKRRKKNTEIGHKTDINTKNNSLSVRYRVTLFAWSYVSALYKNYYKRVYNTDSWETEKQTDTRRQHNFMYISTCLMHQLCSFFNNCCNHEENDKICLLKTGKKTANINVKNLQFMHTVNGDRSKTAKVIKRQH